MVLNGFRGREFFLNEFGGLFAVGFVYVPFLFFFLGGV